MAHTKNKNEFLNKILRLMSNVTDFLVAPNDQEPNLSQPCVQNQGKQKMFDKTRNLETLDF